MPTRALIPQNFPTVGVERYVSAYAALLLSVYPPVLTSRIRKNGVVLWPPKGVARCGHVNQQEILVLPTTGYQEMEL